MDMFIKIILLILICTMVLYGISYTTLSLLEIRRQSKRFILTESCTLSELEEDKTVSDAVLAYKRGVFRALIEKYSSEEHCKSDSKARQECLKELSKFKVSVERSTDTGGTIAIIISLSRVDKDVTTCTDCSSYLELAPAVFLQDSMMYKSLVLGLGDARELLRECPYKTEPMK